jgi:hypothetical protein
MRDDDSRKYALARAKSDSGFWPQLQLRLEYGHKQGHTVGATKTLTPLTSLI